MANPNLNSADDRHDLSSSPSPTNRVATLLTEGATAAEPQRVVYSCRVTIAGNEAEARIAAVKVRAFLRRYLKPKGLTIRLSEEYERKERRASA